MSRDGIGKKYELTRRQTLLSLGIGALGTVPFASAGAADEGAVYYLEQDGMVFPLQPVNWHDGDLEPYSIAEFYNYHEGASRTLVGLEGDATSVVFVYEGPDGEHSLVVVHDRGRNDTAGSVDFSDSSGFDLDRTLSHNLLERPVDDGDVDHDADFDHDVDPGNVPDGATEPDDLAAIHREMVGSGTELDPYGITTVQELQAIDVDRSAHYALATDVDASETQTWNLVEDVTDEYLTDIGRLGSRGRVQVDLPPVEPGSETLFVRTVTEVGEYGERIAEDSESNTESDLEVDESADDHEDVTDEEFWDSYEDQLGDGTIPSDQYEMDYETGEIEFSDSFVTTFPDPEVEEVYVNVDYALADPYFAGFEPIGDGSLGSFTGTLDGRGHSISTLHVERPRDGRGTGLFESTAGTVRDLTIEKATVVGDGRRTGTVAGRNRQGVISDVTTDATVVSTGQRVGGLVAENGGTITGSESNGTVIGDGYSVGGLAGSNRGTISGSDSSTTVAAKDGSNVGGLIGSNRRSGVVRRSSAVGTVEGRRQVGGLAGRNSGGTVRTSWAGGIVREGRTAGGLVGENRGTVEDSYAVGRVEMSSRRVGGLVGRNLQSLVGTFNTVGTIRRCYAAGSISGGQTTGGLVGDNSGRLNIAPGVIEASFWNPVTTGQTRGVGD